VGLHSLILISNFRLCCWPFKRLAGIGVSKIRQN